MTMVLVALLMMSGAYAQLRQGHFFKSLDTEYVSVENAKQQFGQWFSLPADTEWKLVGSETDDLGMTRIEYRQYVGGIEVEHSQVLLHAKQGRVVVANGTVMELASTPQQSAKVRRSALTARGDELVDAQGRAVCLVETNDGYRYAYKTESANHRQWIYTDVETGRELKRISRVRNITVPTGEKTQVQGQSLFSGTVAMDVTKSADGKVWLYDQERNIHTVLAAYLPTFAQVEAAGKDDLYFPEGSNDITLYLQDGDNTIYASNDQMKTTSSQYGAYKLKKLKLTKLKSSEGEIPPADLAQNPRTLLLKIRYGMDTETRKSIGMIEDAVIKIDKLPFEFDFSDYQKVVPRDGITIELDEDTIVDKVDEFFEETTITMKPDDSGSYSFQGKGMDGTITYEPSGDPAVDIHWGMGRTYDFYKEVFNRKSFDNQGSPIYNYMYLTNDKNLSQMNSSLNNAAAITSDKPYPMIYGMGGYYVGYGFFMKPVVELSVMSHEFTHIVTDSSRVR